MGRSARHRAHHEHHNDHGSSIREEGDSWAQDEASSPATQHHSNTHHHHHGRRGGRHAHPSRGAQQQSVGNTRPWYQSTLAVTLVSVVGALAVVSTLSVVTDIVGRHGRGAGAPSGGGHSHAHGHVVSPLGGGAADASQVQEELDIYEATDAFQKGNMEYRNGRFHEALKYYHQAVHLLPAHSFAWANLGNVQRDLGDLAQAVASHRKAVELMPSRARHWYNLGVSLYTQRSIDEAVEAFRSAIVLNDRMGNAHYNLGIALAERGERAEAKRMYERAAALDTNSMLAFGARCNLCNLISHDEGMLAAAQCLMDLITDAPTYERAMVNLAGTLQNLADSFGLVDDAAGHQHTVDAYIGLFASATDDMERVADALRAIAPEDHATAVPKVLLQQAVGLYERVQELNPSNAIAQHALVALRTSLLRAPLSSPANPAHSTASSDGVGVPAQASHAYVRQLFDSYSVEFDASLASLGYQVPELLWEAVAAHLQPGRKLDLALDLGCGTGLNGAWIKSMSKHLIGIDLSVRMLEIAAARSPEADRDGGGDAGGVSAGAVRSQYYYDELVEMDIVGAMELRAERSVELLVAADVLCYFGDIRPVIGAAARVTKAGGVFAFTVEDVENEERGNDGQTGDVDWAISASGRYRHSETYVRSLATEAGFVVASHKVVDARRKLAHADSGAIRAHLFVLAMPRTKTETGNAATATTAGVDADAEAGALGVGAPL